MWTAQWKNFIYAISLRKFGTKTRDCICSDLSADLYVYIIKPNYTYFYKLTNKVYCRLSTTIATVKAPFLCMKRVSTFRYRLKVSSAVKFSSMTYKFSRTMTLANQYVLLPPNRHTVINVMPEKLCPVYNLLIVLGTECFLFYILVWYFYKDNERMRFNAFGFESTISHSTRRHCNLSYGCNYCQSGTIYLKVQNLTKCF